MDGITIDPIVLERCNLVSCLFPTIKGPKSVISNFRQK